MALKDDLKALIIKSGWTMTQVVEELNNVSFLSETRHCENGFPIDNVVLLDKAIEIVKAGVKNEN